jgi:hypothetical protein
LRDLRAPWTRPREEIVALDGEILAMNKIGAQGCNHDQAQIPDSLPRSRVKIFQKMDQEISTAIENTT